MFYFLKKRVFFLVVDCKGGLSLEKTMGLNSVENVLIIVIGKTGSDSDVRGGSRAVVTSKMELTKCSILDVAAVLDPPPDVDLVVKHLRCINCLNVCATYCADF